MIIALSGMDGSGKSTQVSILQEFFSSNGKASIILWTRGGYTPGFLWLKSLLRVILGRHLPPPGKSPSRDNSLSRPFVARLWLSIAIIDLLFYLGIYLRLQHIRGRVVICDRYIDDTRLDFKRNFPHISFENFLLWRVLEWAVPVPDVSLLLWIPVEFSLNRSINKNEPFPDNEETLQWRLESYLDETLFPPSRYTRIDCQQDIDSVSSQIKSYLMTVSQKNN